MQDIVELERRIAAALERIGRAIDALPAVTLPVETAVAEAVQAVAEEPAIEEPLAEPEAQPAPLAADALTGAGENLPETGADDDRLVIRRLRQKLAAANDRETVLRGEYDERIAVLTHQLDVSGLELQRMRKSTVLLREELRRLREAQAQGLSDPSLINRALLAELDALRAIRLSEVAELDDLNAALAAHLAGAETAEATDA